MFEMNQRIKGFLSFLLKNNIFIAFCAVGMCLNTSILLNVPFRDFSFYGFIFSATLFSYNIYYLKDKAHPYALLFTIIGIVLSCIFFYLCNSIFTYDLVFISILSALYILPGYLGFKGSKYYLLFKLLILVFVWTNTTVLVPLIRYEVELPFLLFYINRFLLIWNLSMLFFIKDEESKFPKNSLRISLYCTLLLQFINSIYYTYSISIEYGLLFILMSVILLSISIYFLRIKKTQLYYLFFVDGIMLLESIFVFILQFSFQD
jgi:hypothetical protein